MQKKNFVARAEIFIKAPKAEVWNALITPEIISQYLFGTKVSSDWKEGSEITYEGAWEGRSYQDKATILKMEPETLLVTSYWSPFFELPDTPENYKKVSYELSGQQEGTQLIITQDNNPTQEEAQHSQQNWKLALSKMKELLEKKSDQTLSNI